ncbi:hypothetical protein SEA_PHEROBRINE_67 [Gordonia phage Pherobrine]|nr:hypothetical protein SEA_PHEROBRINE_67 [Gordonia phage Pherobrine]
MNDEDDRKISHIFDKIKDGTIRFTDEGVPKEFEEELDKSMSRHPAGKKRKSHE